MTRFLSLTRGGWPAEVLCEATVGVAPLCVKHMLPNGNVSVQMHRLDGRISLRGESPHDLIPAPEPSEAAVEAAVRADDEDRPYETIAEAVRRRLCAAYAEDGITPQQQPDRVAEMEAEVAKLRAERDKARAEVERMRAWKPSDAAAREAWSSRYLNVDDWRDVLAAGFRADFPDTQPSTGEQA